MLRYKSLIAAGSLAAGVALLPQVSSAQIWVGTDPRGDVVEVHAHAGPSGEDYGTVRPRWAHGDVRRLRVNHADSRIRASLKFRNINRRVYTSHDFVFRTRQGEWYLSFDHTGRRIEPFSRFWYDETRDVMARCPRLRIGINVAEDRVRVSVPRGCIGRPGWVRVGARTWGRGEDVALRRGRNSFNYSFPDPLLSARVFRG